MHKNLLKEKLRAGQRTFGIFCNYPTPALVEVAGHLGFDCVIIDAEHGPMDLQTCEHMVRAAHCAGITPILRLPYSDPRLINRYLDTGAHGIMAPHFDSVERAKAIVAGAKYYPLGNRGAGANTRAADYGMTLSGSEYAAWANEETMVLGILEDAHVQSVLPDVLRVEGVDGVGIGPADLAQSMGLPGQINHPSVVEKVNQMSRVVMDSGKVLTKVVMNPANAVSDIKEYTEMGVPLILVSMHALLSNTIREFLSNKTIARPKS
jgi:4-hydroxy-2-oxoheptanedioate aldolase